MKKLFAVLMVFTLLFAVAACDETGTTEGDTVKPVISGVSTTEINVGDTFDPLVGVTASDDVDGDITSKIEVTGTVDVNRPGDYILTYRVEDLAGNEDIKQRVVSVVGLAGFLNGDFADGLNGWSTWFNESQGVNVEYTAEAGVATIDIKEQAVINDNNWWDVQLSQKTLNLKAFESYTLKFTVSAEAARKMIVQIQGGGLAMKPINERIVDITTTEQVIEIDFYSIEDSKTGTELQFALGTFHKVADVPVEQQTVLGKVFIKDIQIIAGPELENQAPTLNVGPDVLLPVGATNFLVKGGIKVSDDRTSLNIDDVTFEDVSVVPYVIGEPAVKGVYEFKYTVADEEGLETIATRKLYVADAFDIPEFSEVNVETGLPFGFETWFEETRGGLTATTVDGVVEIDITNIAAEGGNMWENQFKIMNLAAFVGNYRLSFEAKADVARSIIVAMEGNGGVEIENISFDQALTTEFKTYTFDFQINVNATVMNRNLQFWFGSLVNRDGFTAADDILTKLYFKNVSIVKTDDISYGDELVFDYVQGFWSDNATSISPDTDALYNKYVGVLPIVKGLLPVGSTILLEAGYQYRTIFLEKTSEGFKVVNRTGNSTAPYVAVDEDFWKDYQYVAFNISAVPTVDISAEIDNVASKLQLFHPEGTLDNHIDLDLVWSNGYYMNGDTALTVSDNHLATNPLSPQFYNLDTVIEVEPGYKFAYVLFSYENRVYTVTSVSDYQTEPLWVNPAFAEGKDLIGFIVTTTDETTPILPVDLETIVDLHPNKIEHMDMAINYVSGYWNDKATKITTGDTTFIKGFAASNVLSKHYFENATELMIETGYQAKMIFLSYDGYGNYKVTRRTDNLTGTVAMDADFWGDDEYLAFNLSTVPSTDLSLDLEALNDKIAFTINPLEFVSGYWNTNKSAVTPDVKYIASNVMPRQFFPAGTIVNVEAGYEAKISFLTYSPEAGYKVASRTGALTGSTVITDALYKDYQYIAFNLSTAPTTDISTIIETVAGKLTFSEFTDAIIEHVDMPLSFVTGYYEDNKTTITTGDTAFIKGFAVSNVISKESLAGKESIVIAEGYQVRVIFIGYDHNVYTVMKRTANTSGTIILDDSFFEDYQYIAFNISTSPSTDLSGVLETLPSKVSFVDAIE